MALCILMGGGLHPPSRVWLCPIHSLQKPTTNIQLLSTPNSKQLGQVSLSKMVLPLLDLHLQEMLRSPIISSFLSFHVEACCPCNKNKYISRTTKTPALEDPILVEALACTHGVHESEEKSLESEETREA